VPTTTQQLGTFQNSAIGVPFWMTECETLIDIESF